MILKKKSQHLQLIILEKGLEMTFYKTENIIWNGNENSDSTNPEFIKIQDVNLVTTKHFKDLDAEHFDVIKWSENLSRLINYD